MASSSSAADECVSPPWVELPRDITAVILHKVGAIEMLVTAQFVCKAWLSVCRDPSMWRSIDLRIPSFALIPFGKLCREAVDRSQGQLVDISIEYFCKDKFLLYISQRASQLRRLSMEYCYDVMKHGMIEACGEFHELEELYLHYSFIDERAIEAIGRSCPRLKSFTLSNYWERGPVSDDDARAISENMPELRHLCLVLNPMTREGLEAILDGCPHLESLDLRHCFNVDFAGKKGRLCRERMRKLKRRPDGSELDDDDDDYPYLGCDE